MAAPLEVRGLRTTLFTRRGEMKAVDGLSLRVEAGETVALVGESGCGKSLSALSIMRLLPDPPARLVGGSVILNGRDLVPLPEEAMLDIRGKEIGMIFQDPMSSLNPVATVEKQIAEVLMAHTTLGRGQARARVHELLEQVGMPDAGRRLDAYPHQLSGGMCQRVMIAMAIACSPSVLIADEPTTALDVTVQAQVLTLLKRLQADAGMAMIFITHDLGVVAETADRVVVMYAGRKVEEAAVDDLFEAPLHPYTVGLIGATPVPGAERAARLADIPGMVPPLNALPAGCAFAPRCKRVMDRCWKEPPQLTEPRPGRLVACFAAEQGRGMTKLLALSDVHVRFNTAAGVVRAVNGVSLDLAVGETLGLVGESGCGKSTLGKAIMKLVPVSAGAIEVDGVDIAPMQGEALTGMRRKVQMIFQDPYGSLNPRSTIGRSVAQPLVVAGWKADAIAERVDTLLRWVGLPDDARQRYPHEFSGGQRQRIGIARALALSPKLIICDEPVSALDVSVRAQVINLLEDLKQQFGVSYLFISHDLSVVEHIADRVAVMYLGTIVEAGGRDQIWRRPQHPYTKALLEAAPVANPKLARARQRTVLQGELPSPLSPPAGCPFHSRCPIAQERCTSDRPVLRPVGGGTLAACHFI